MRGVEGIELVSNFTRFEMRADRYVEITGSRGQNLATDYAEDRFLSVNSIVL